MHTHPFSKSHCCIKWRTRGLLVGYGCGPCDPLGCGRVCCTDFSPNTVSHNAALINYDPTAPHTHTPASREQAHYPRFQPSSLPVAPHLTCNQHSDVCWVKDLNPSFRPNQGFSCKTEPIQRPGCFEDQYNKLLGHCNSDILPNGFNVR